MGALGASDAHGGPMSATSDIAQRRALARETGDEDYHQRRADLVAAAARVFRRKGFRAANLQDIASEFGTERASLYYYTSGKDELFRDVVLEAARENVVMVETLVAAEEKATSKLNSFIEQLMESYERHYPYLFVYVQENMTQIDDRSAWGSEMRQIERRFDDAVRRIVQQGIDEGSLLSSCGDARLIANGVIGMCNWSHRWFHAGAKGGAQAVSAAFSAMILNGLATE
jgi:AcrR family transcriptional regulator